MKDRSLERRVPVVYKGKPLMPMRWGRAVKYIRLGKARFRLHRKLGIKYLELLTRPCDMKTQKVVLGFDPGSVYDGFSVVSDQCHHENFELIHNENIKKRMDSRRSYRKNRRSRLRGRKCRQDNRTASRLVPTVLSMYHFRIWLVDRIKELFPVSIISYEHPGFDFRFKKYNKYAMLTTQGLSKFLSYLSNLKIKVIKSSGRETSERRLNILGSERKSTSKKEKSFFAHCIDSFSLATIGLEKFDYYNILSQMNKKSRFTQKIWYTRRELYKYKAPQLSKSNPHRCYYIKYLKGGEIKRLDPWYGQENRVSGFMKVKIQKFFNSFKSFDFMYVRRTPRVKRVRVNYGGTVWYGISKKGQYKMNSGGKMPDIRKKSELCKWISKNIRDLRFLGYMNQQIEVCR